MNDTAGSLPVPLNVDKAPEPADAQVGQPSYNASDLGLEQEAGDAQAGV